MALINRAYPSNRFALDLDKTMSGWLSSAEGGHAVTEPVKSRLAGAYGSRQYPGVTKFEDITITCGTGMSRQFYDWLKSSLDYDHLYHDGAVIAADYDLKETNRLTFSRGLITEFGLPALDAKKNELCHLTAKITPEETKMEFSPGRKNSVAQAPTNASIQKKWLTSAFNLKIDGMKCDNVITVDALVFKQQTVDNPVGESKYPDKHPVHINFPDIVLTIPESDAEPWYKWHREFVVEGSSDKRQEPGGSLEFLTANRSTVLFTVNFPLVGITKFVPDKMEAGSDKIRTVKITMYCERADFKYSAGAVGNSTWE